MWTPKCRIYFLRWFMNNWKRDIPYWDNEFHITCHTRWWRTRISPMGALPSLRAILNTDPSENKMQQDFPDWNISNERCIWYLKIIHFVFMFYWLFCNNNFWFLAVLRLLTLKLEIPIRQTDRQISWGTVGVNNLDPIFELYGREGRFCLQSELRYECL